MSGVKPWSTVPVSKLPTDAFSLQTYAPNDTGCIAGHRFASEADCILPEDEVDAWDYFLCRRCVEDIGGLRDATNFAPDLTKGGQ